MEIDKEKFCKRLAEITTVLKNKESLVTDVIGLTATIIGRAISDNEDRWDKMKQKLSKEK